MFVGARLQIRILRKISWVTTTNVTNKDMRHMNAKPRHQAHKDLKVTTITTRSTDIECISKPN